MDLSQFNAAEQAELQKIIEQKQVNSLISITLIPGYLDEGFSEVVFWPRQPMFFPLYSGFSFIRVDVKGRGMRE